jgi:hypothetical protein
MKEGEIRFVQLLDSEVFLTRSEMINLTDWNNFDYHNSE